MNLLTELRRRNVIKVTVFYLVTSWLLLQAGDVLFDLLGLPDWTLRLVLGILLLGLPIVVAFSWIYELTPDGVKREKEIDRSQSITPHTGRKLNNATMAVAVLAIALVAAQQFGLLSASRNSAELPQASQEVAPESVEAATDAQPEDNRPSIAVLPFADMSQANDQEYFSDGLADTLMHVLAQVKTLRVAARTSSFAFKGQNMDVGEIARQLGVSTILEGSVQKSGQKIRVIAQLIDASDGSHIWSANFDRALEDIFAVQDEIADEVVRALKVNLLEEDKTRLTERYRPSLEAYEQVILGRQEEEKRTAVSLAAAESHYTRAIELDPAYAIAYVGLADVYTLQTDYSDLLPEDSWHLREPLVKKAIELDPQSGEALTSKAQLLNETGQIAASEQAFRRAIELNPSYARAFHWYSNVLKGREAEALEKISRASQLDPLSPIIRNTHAAMLITLGRISQAETMLREGLRRNPEFPNYYGQMEQIRSIQGRLGEARRWNLEEAKRNPGNVYSRAQDCKLLMELADDLGADSCLRKLESDYPGDSRIGSGRGYQSFLLGNYRENLQHLSTMMERYNDNALRVSFYAGIAARAHYGLDEIDEADQLLRQHHPGFYIDQAPRINAINSQFVAVAAWVAHRQGDNPLAYALLDQYEIFVAPRRTGRQDYVREDAMGLLLRGQPDQAIARIREGIDAGWREGWRFLKIDSRFDAIAKDPRFVAMIAELESDMLAQRQWFDEQKDEALF